MDIYNKNNTHLKSTFYLTTFRKKLINLANTHKSAARFSTRTYKREKLNYNNFSYFILSLNIISDSISPPVKASFHHFTHATLSIGFGLYLILDVHNALIRAKFLIYTTYLFYQIIFKN